MNTATLVDDQIKVQFTYSPDLVEKVKELDNRKYHNDGWNDKYWTAPLNMHNIELLLQIEEIEVDDALKEWYKNKTEFSIKRIKEIPGLKGILYPFQKEGVEFIESRNGRALIGDEMGTGKTIQSLAYLQFHPELRPAIIVCPATVKLFWRQSTLDWTTETNVEVLSGKQSSPITGQIIILNYDILQARLNDIQMVSPKIIILDEIHYIKSSRALRTKATKKLCKGAKHIIGLSGTPIVNRPIEFFGGLKIIDPTLFPNRWKYAEHFCDLKHDGFGWNMNGASNTEELHDKLVKTIMIRRLKKDVLKELPPKVRTVVPLELDNEAEYKQAENDFISWLGKTSPEKAEKASRAEALTKIEALKQLTIKGKMKQCIEWIKDFLETREKLAVFCTHRKTVEILHQEFHKVAVTIDGSTSLDDRQTNIDKFQKDNDCRLVIGNIKAMGVGISLTAASNTCFVELGWTPAEMDQAEDRVHRIGQEADSVNAWYLIAQNSIEEEIIKLLDEKRKILINVLDGKEVEDELLLSGLMTILRD